MRFLTPIGISWFQPRIKGKPLETSTQTRASYGIPIKADTPEKPIASAGKHSLQPEKVIIPC
jgi:hypothetical protein